MRVILVGELTADVTRQLARHRGREIEAQGGEPADPLGVEAIATHRDHFGTDDEAARIVTSTAPRPIRIEGRRVGAVEVEVERLVIGRGQIGSVKNPTLAAIDFAEGIIGRQIVCPDKPHKHSR